MDCSPPGSSVHGIFQAIIVDWVAMPFSRDLPDLGMEPKSPTLQADSLLFELPRKIQIEWRLSPKARVPWGVRLISFYGLHNFIGLQVEEMEKWLGFSGIGTQPTFWILWSTLELSWGLWVCHLASCCITMSIQWGSRSNGSQIFHHFGPESESCSVVSDSLWPHGPIQSMEFSRPEYWTG